MSVVAAIGYRSQHAGVLEGAWVAGELLCFARNEARAPTAIRSAVAQPDITGPFASTERLLVVPGLAFIRFVEIEPVHRRARLEIGVQGTFDEATATAILAHARTAAFSSLNLLRVYGWVRPGHAATRAVLADAGFEYELTMPEAMRLGGAPAGREIWAALR